MNGDGPRFPRLPGDQARGADDDVLTRSNHKLGLQANIYNVLNINDARAVTPLAGPNFNISTSITPPRIGEVGLTYTF